jgi:O-antigen/teichoic acid export membrane protein
LKVKSIFTSPSALRKNVTANFIGNISAPLLNFVFVPFYLKYIGAEGYGLIGIFTSLQVLLSFLDSGLSTTLNKELAGMRAISNTQARMRNLVRTLGNLYWIIAITAGIIAVSLSSFMANHWVLPNELSRDTIQTAFILMSVSLVFQFPYGFYSGGLLGLEQHVLLNILRVTFAVLRSAGAFCVLVFYSKSC